VRVAVAATAAYSAYVLLGLPQGYWAVFSAVIVVQSSIGATLTLSIERMMGTITGAVIGGLAVWLHPHTPLGLGLGIALSVAIASFAAAARADLKVAPITAVIMLISPSGQAMGPLETAVLRVVEIGVGSLIGVLATLLIFPARAHLAATARIRAVMGDIATMTEACAARLRGEAADVFANAARIRAGLAAVEAALADAGRERSTRLGGRQLPHAIGRTLWRLRNDAVVLARITDGGLPGPVVRVAPAAEALLRAEAAFLRLCADRLNDGRIERAGLAAAYGAFQASVEAVRRERLTSDLTVEAVSPLFGAVFATESLYRNLGDLADRIEETAGTRPAATAVEAV
jgi:uncharacterized membrane protein YccC